MNDRDGTIVELTGVDKSYGAPGGAVDVLRGVNLRVRRGESLAVLGPSGCGKSTLLNVIGALDLPTRGTARLEGRDLTELDERELDDVRNRRIGFVFQLHHLLPQCTVLENVLVPTIPADVDPDAAAARARELLDRVGLTGRAGHRPGQLSGGERQRVAVVRALINDPALILADEPTGSLDRASSGQLADLLVELNRERGVTLIVVTHAEYLGGRMSRVCSLQDGRLEQAGANA